MNMTFRWYGEGNDSVNLSDVKQIPGVKGIVWALHNKQAGEVWNLNEIEVVKNQIEPYGFHMEVVESVNVHEDIKLGLPTREKYIENYKQTLINLSKYGVKVVCYNFMPVFDWTRTDLFHPLADGSTALFYEKSKIFSDPSEMIKIITDCSGEFTMPGWEPERLSKINDLFLAYKDITKDQLWSNLKYFLEEIMPVCEQCGIKMAIHQDDPPWDIFGLPRLIVDKQSIGKLLKLVDHPCNGLTLCSGSLGANKENNISDIIITYSKRIYFAHIRNVKHYSNGDFTEVSHRDCDGDVGILDIVKSYYDTGYKGYVRPDHGRHIWNEKCRPGYGLYDRALGIMYLLGAWDILCKQQGISN